jgi:hypothetical protein
LEATIKKDGLIIPTKQPKVYQNSAK